MPLSDEKTGEKTRVHVLDVFELKIFRRRGDAVVKHVFQTGPTHIAMEGRVGVTTTGLRVRTRCTVSLRTDGTRTGILRETGVWTKGRTKKTAPFGVKTRVQVYFGARVRAGVRVRVRVFSTVSCFTPRVFLLAATTTNSARRRFYSFVYYYPRFFVLFPAPAKRATRRELSRGELASARIYRD